MMNFKNNNPAGRSNGSYTSVWARRLALFLAVFMVFQGVPATIVMALESFQESLPQYECDLDEHEHDDDCYAYVLMCTIEETAAVTSVPEAVTSAPAPTTSTPETSASVPETSTPVTVQEPVPAPEGVDTEVITAGAITPKASTPNVEGHSHGSSCYTYIRVCGKISHNHTSQCYSYESGINEYLCKHIEHTHSDMACNSYILTCNAEHEHTVYCYTETRTCNLEEHIHDYSCLPQEIPDEYVCHLMEHEHKDECSSDCRINEHNHLYDEETETDDSGFVYPSDLNYFVNTATIYRIVNEYERTEVQQNEELPADGNYILGISFGENLSDGSTPQLAYDESGYLTYTFPQELTVPSGLFGYICNQKDVRIGTYKTETNIDGRVELKVQFYNIDDSGDITADPIGINIIEYYTNTYFYIEVAVQLSESKETQEIIFGNQVSITVSVPVSPVKVPDKNKIILSGSATGSVIYSEPIKQGMLLRSTAQTSNANLNNFITGVVIKDSNGNQIPSNGEVLSGEKYTIILSFKETLNLQFVYENGYLYYDIPDNIFIPETLRNTPYDIYARGTNKSIGTYTVSSDGRSIAVQFGDYLSNGNPNPGVNFIKMYGDAEFAIEMLATFTGGEGIKTIDFGSGKTIIITIKDKEAYPTIIKSASGNPKYNPDTKTIEYKVEITANDGGLHVTKFSDIPKVGDDILTPSQYSISDVSYKIGDGTPTQIAANIVNNNNKDASGWWFDITNGVDISDGQTMTVTYKLNIGAYLIYKYGYAGANYSFSVNNIAKITCVDSNNNPWNEESGKVTVPIINKWIAKSGVKNSDGTITWTINIGDGINSLNGVTITDELGYTANSGSVSIAFKGKTGNSVSNPSNYNGSLHQYWGFRYTIPSDRTDIYYVVITYTTDSGNNTSSARRNTVKTGEKTGQSAEANVGVGEAISGDKWTEKIYKGENGKYYADQVIKLNIPAGCTSLRIEDNLQYAFRMPDGRIEYDGVENLDYIQLFPKNVTFTVTVHNANGTTDEIEFQQYIPTNNVTNGYHGAPLNNDYKYGKDANGVYWFTVLSDYANVFYTFWCGPEKLTYGSYTVNSAGKWAFPDNATDVEIKYSICLEDSKIIKDPDSNNGTIIFSPYTGSDDKVSKVSWNLLELLQNEKDIQISNRVDAYSNGVEGRENMCGFITWPIHKEAKFNEDDGTIEYTVYLRKQMLGMDEIFTEGFDAIFEDYFDDRFEYVPKSFYMDVIDYDYDDETESVIENPAFKPFALAAYDNQPWTSNSPIKYVKDADVVEDPNALTSGNGYLKIYLNKMRTISGMVGDNVGIYRSPLNAQITRENDPGFWIGEETDEVIYCWYHIFAIHYKLRPKVNTIIDEEITVANTAGIIGTYVHDGKFTSDCEVDYESKVVTKDMDVDGRYASFDIVVNPLGSSLADGKPLLIKDTMNNTLSFYLDTIEVWTESVKYSGNFNTKKTLKEVGELPAVLGTDDLYKWAVTGENEVTFILPDKTPLKIIYSALIKGDVGDTVTVENYVWVEGGYVDEVKDTFTVAEATGAGSGSLRELTLYKKDSENTATSLKGAKFDLYIGLKNSAWNPEGTVKSWTFKIGDLYFYFLQPGTTNIDGKIVFNDSNLVYMKEAVFALVETEAPAGYEMTGDMVDSITGITYPNGTTSMDGAIIFLSQSVMGDIVEGIPVQVVASSITISNDPIHIGVEIPVRKIIDGHTTITPEFKYWLRQINADGTPMIKDGDVVEFSGTTHGDTGSTRYTFNLGDLGAGTYYYTLSEEPNIQNLPKWEYDPKVYKIKVVVSHDETGMSYTITDISDAEDEKSVENVTFTNKYAHEPAKAEIVGTKIVSGVDVPDATFTINLIQVADQDGGTYSGTGTPISKEFTINTDGSGSYPFWFTLNELETNGTYYFKITEENDGSTGWKYDETSYIVKVVVYSGHAEVYYPDGTVVGGVSQEIADGQKISFTPNPIIDNSFRNYFHVRIMTSSPARYRYIVKDSTKPKEGVVVPTAYCINEPASNSQSGYSPYTDFEGFKKQYPETYKQILWLVRNGFWSSTIPTNELKEKAPSDLYTLKSGGELNITVAGTNLVHLVGILQDYADAINEEYLRDFHDDEPSNYTSAPVAIGKLLTEDYGPERAYSATQFAIWYFTNPELRNDHAEEISPYSGRASAAYLALIAAANDAVAKGEVITELTLGVELDASLANEIDGFYGPITVNVNMLPADATAPANIDVLLTPANGFTLYDKDKSPLSVNTLNPGDKFYINVGNTSLPVMTELVTAKATLSAGATIKDVYVFNSQDSNGDPKWGVNDNQPIIGIGAMPNPEELSATSTLYYGEETSGELVFNNTYNTPTEPPPPSTVIICGTKSVVGEKAPTGVEFTFTLTQVDSSGDPIANPIVPQMTTTVTTDKVGSKDYQFNFKLPQDFPIGTYYFKIEETGTGGAGWTPNTTSQIVTLHVKSDGASKVYMVNYPGDHDPYTWEEPTINHPFGSASYYGVFALGNVTVGDADTEGGMAVKGNFREYAYTVYNQQGYNIGIPNRYYNSYALPIRAYTPRLLVGGNISVEGGITAFGGQIRFASTSVVAAMSGSVDSKFYEYVPLGSNATDPFFTYVANQLPPLTLSLMGIGRDTTSTVPSLYGTTAGGVNSTNNNPRRVSVTTLNSFFTAAETSLQALSQSYKTATNNDNDTTTLVLNATGVSTAVYTIDLAALAPTVNSWSQYDTVIVNFPFADHGNTYLNIDYRFPTDFYGRVVVNFEVGASVTVTGNMPKLYIGNDTITNPSIISDRIILNFPNSGTTNNITQTASSVGYILAPNTNFTLLGGRNVSGDIVCKDYITYKSGDKTASHGNEQHNSNPSKNYLGQLKFVNTYEPTGGPKFPGTGGIGTTKLTTIGLGLMLMSALLIAAIPQANKGRKRPKLRNKNYATPKINIKKHKQKENKTMKKFSKLFAIFTLVALLVTSMVPVSVFAVEPTDGTIDIKPTIGKSIDDWEFTAYKIFNLEITRGTGTPPSNDEYAYTLVDKFEDFEKDAAFLALATPATTLAGYLNSDSPDMTELSKLLYDYIAKYNTDNPTEKIEAIQGTGSDTAAEFTGLTYGYYLIYSKTTVTGANGNVTIVAACSLTTAEPDAEAILKGDVPTIDKQIWDHEKANGSTPKTPNDTDKAWTDDTDLNIGDTAYFKLTSFVPNMTGYDKYKFIVTDTISKGLDLVLADPATDNKPLVEVKIGGETILAEGHYTVSALTSITEEGNYKGGHKFTITFDPTWFATLDDADNDDFAAGDIIEITYSAIVNGDAVIGAPGNPNKVDLTYSNDTDFDGDGDTDKTPEEEVIVYTFDFDIFKYAIAGDEEPFALANAEFKLSLTENGNALKFFKVSDGAAEVPANEDAQTPFIPAKPTVYRPFIEGKDSGNGVTTLVTSASGLIAFTGMDAGTYYLTETKAPEGYNLLADPIEIVITHVKDTVTGKGTGVYTVTADDQPLGYYGDIDNPSVLEDVWEGIVMTSPILDILNRAGGMFPGTGGIGRTIFILVGATMIGAGLISLVVFRKKIFGTK